MAASISPYLQLHADDPVQWRDWSPALLEEARATGRPLLISSGYYACHWCHVMQEESFRDAGIAERLNRDYIPVKVDRELNAALDQYLLEFLRATRGSAGWPLNVVILPPVTRWPVSSTRRAMTSPASLTGSRPGSVRTATH
jgi:uncharacterized protein